MNQDQTAKYMDANTPTPANASASPFNIEYIMVLCSNLRHMAYLDKAGKWRDAYDNLELTGPVRVLW